MFKQKGLNANKQKFRMSESMMHLSTTKPKKKIIRQHNLDHLNEKLSPRSMVLVGFLGAMSGFSGAMMSLV